jgi:integrase
MEDSEGRGMSVYRQKGTKFYTMDFWFNGVHIKESTKVSTLTMARTVERNRRRELEEGRAGVKKSEGPGFFKQTAERWLEMKSATLEPNAVRIERTNLDHLYPTFAKKFVTEISAEQIAAYQKKRVAEGYAHKTINLEIGTLRSVLIYCGQWARVKGEGNMRSSKVRLLATRESHGKAITAEQESKLAVECGKSRSRCLVVMFILALYTGSRFGVVRRLKWENVDFSRRRLQWGKDKTRSGDHRFVPLARRAYESLLLWKESFPNRQPEHYVFPYERIGGKGHKFGKEGNVSGGVAYKTDPTRPVGSIKTGWKNAQERSGVVCRIHDLRHTAATRMFEAGYELRQVSAIMGWSASQEVRMARIYSHFCTEKNRPAVEAIDILADKSPSVSGPPKSPTNRLDLPVAESPKLLI